MRGFVTARVRALVVGAALVGSGGALAAIPSQASAGAFGRTAVGSGLPWYGLNSAYTCIDIDGWGNHVVSVQGEWFGIGTLGNYRFGIRFRDINGNLCETTISRPTRAAA